MPRIFAEEAVINAQYAVELMAEELESATVASTRKGGGNPPLEALVIAVIVNWRILFIRNETIGVIFSFLSSSIKMLN